MSAAQLLNTRYGAEEVGRCRRLKAEEAGGCRWWVERARVRLKVGTPRKGNGGLLRHAEPLGVGPDIVESFFPKLGREGRVFIFAR